MEIFDLYDRNGTKLNKTMERGGSNGNGEYHMVTHIWFRNSKNQYLIQQRNKQEDLVPYQWAATGGAILQGETSIEGTLREVREELGLELKEEDLILVKRYYITHPISNYITDLYLVKMDIDLSTLRLDPTEVKAVGYKTMEEIKTMVKEHTFWDYTHMMERRDYLSILEKS